MALLSYGSITYGGGFSPQQSLTPCGPIQASTREPYMVVWTTPIGLPRLVWRALAKNQHRPENEEVLAAFNSDKGYTSYVNVSKAIR